MLVKRHRGTWVEHVLVYQGRVGSQGLVRYGEKNPLLGQMVSAEVVYTGPERGAELTAAIRRHCMQKLPPHKVPVRVRAVEMVAMGTHKKLRRERVDLT